MLAMDHGTGAALEHAMVLAAFAKGLAGSADTDSKARVLIPCGHAEVLIRCGPAEVLLQCGPAEDESSHPAG